MDVVTYAILKKKIEGVAGGVSGYEIDGTTLKITTTDGQVLEMTFPEPKDGISINDVKINESNHLVCTMSDGNEIDAGLIKTIKGPKGDPFKYEDFTPEQLESLKGPAGKDGEDGQPGKDGYTPQKGIDYFTEDDINEVVKDMHLENYLTTEQAKKEYATKAEIPNTKDFITKTTADETYATKEEVPSLEDYYTKEETNDAIAEAITGGTVDLKDYLKKTEAQDTYLDKVTAENTYLKKDEEPELTDYLKKDEANETYETKIEHKADLDKKVDAVIENEKGTAAILNNETGGQLLYLNNENNVRANISVNNGSSNVYAQLSVTDKDTNMGARIDVNNEKAYYTTGKSTPEFSDDDELVTKKDVYSKQEADEKFLTEHQDLSNYATNAGVDNKLENYYDKTASDEKYVNKDYTYTKAEVDEKITEAASGGEISLDGYLKTEDADKKYATKESLDSYVEKRVIGDKGIAVVSNDPTGGIMKFTSNTGEEMGVAVNDGSEGIYTQMYAKDAETGAGTRLTLDKEHAYVKTGNDHTFSADDVIVTKKDLPDTSEFITETEVNTKLDEYYTKTDIDDKHFLTEHQDISGLATKEEVELKADKTDLNAYETTAHATETYALKTDMPSLDDYITEAAADLKYATKQEIPSLNGYAKTEDIAKEYATKTEIADFVDEATVDSKLEDYVTNEALETKGYLTEHQDISGLAKKDEVYSITDTDDKFMTNSAATAALENKIDKEEGKQLSQENFTTALKDKLDSLENADLTDYYNKSEVDAKIPDVSQYITKAVEDLVNYYTKSETYTKQEVEKLISQIKSTSFEVVEELPNSEIKPNIIYLLLLEKSEEKNKYAEYIYVSSEWEKLGDLTSNIDLSSFEAEIALKANTADVYTKLEADELFAKIEDIPTALPNPHKLTLTFNGEEFVVYDGSEDINKDIDIDVAAIPGLDEEIERLIAEHGTTEGFYPFESGKGVWELDDAAYKISGNNQTLKYDNYDNTTINNGGYLYITSDGAYKYFTMIKNKDTYFNIEYGRVELNGTDSTHNIFSTQDLIDLKQVVESTTLEVIE